MPGPPSALEICRTDLFTSKEELLERFPDFIVERVMRIRAMYNWLVATPSATDKQFVDECVSRYSVSKVKAYSDLAVVKQLLPVFSSSSRDFHRWRYNEMIMKTFKMAELRKDTRTMERAASSYAKNNRVDLEDEQALPYDMIVPQQFTATSDPSVLGIKPIPNVEEKMKSLIDKYRRETIDIDDVEFEEVDLELDSLTVKDSADGQADLF